MANFYGLILGLLFSFSVSAATCTNWKMASPADGVTMSPHFKTRTAVCNWAAAQLNAAVAEYTYSNSTVVAGGCRIKRMPGATYHIDTYEEFQGPCANNADDEACNSAAVVGNTEFGMHEVAGKVPSGTFCLDTAGVSDGKGCRVDFVQDYAAYYVDRGGWRSQGVITRRSGDNQSCTSSPEGVPPTPENPAPVEPSKCPAGQAPGQVNGLDVCAKIGAEVPKEVNVKKDEVTNKPDGSTVSESTSEKMLCDGKQCTTTKTITTKKTPSGGGPAVTETEVKTSTCKVGQGSCGVVAGGTGSGGAGGEGSSFAGSCSTAFVCKGDAIQCATAQSAAKLQCASERGPMPVAEPVPDTVVDSPLEKSTGWGPEDSSCPAPKVMNLSFASIAVPLDILCEFAIRIRPFVVGLAYLSAALIFFGFARKS